MNRYQHQVLNPADCTTFYKCQKNYQVNGGYEAILMKCPKTTGFDQNLSNCNHLTRRKLPRCYKGKFLYFLQFLVNCREHWWASMSMCPASFLNQAAIQYVFKNDMPWWPSRSQDRLLCFMDTFNPLSHALWSTITSYSLLEHI